MLEWQIVVDSHTHILPAKLPDFAKKFGYGNFLNYRPKIGKMDIYLGKKYYSTIEPNFFDVATRLSEAEEQGVEIQVISPPSVMFAYWAKPKDTLEVARYLNNDIAKKVQAYPSRFVGLGTIPIQDPELALEEMDRCIKDLELRGIIIGSNYKGKYLGDDFFKPIFERANELGISIFVHPLPLQQEKLTRQALFDLSIISVDISKSIISMIINGTMDQFTNIRFAFGNAGGAFPYLIDRLEQLIRSQPSLVGSLLNKQPISYLGKFWVDTEIQNPKLLDFVISMVGEDKVMLGSGYPLSANSWIGGMIEERIVPESVKAKILGENGMKWLNLPKSYFF